jgi:hypothetical protein
VTEPVSLAEARAQVDIIDPSETDFDSLLEDQIIPQARALVERRSRYFLVATSRSETFTSWGGERHRNFSFSRHSCDQYLEIWRRPIASVDHIYYGPNGDDTDTEYTGQVAPVGRFPLRVYPAADNSFPALDRGNVITVEYTSGALDPSSEEYLILKRAILLTIGHWFANRESVIADVRAAVQEVPDTAQALIADVAPLPAY